MGSGRRAYRRKHIDKGAFQVSWLRDVFGKDKVIIGMAHLPPLPGTPLYDAARGVEGIIESIHGDVEALQAGGIDAVMFCNENDRPYTLKAGPETAATMARVITEVRPALSVPFGVDVLWDPVAAIAIAHATGGVFVREVFTGAYAGDIGIWNTNAGEALRFRRQIGAERVKLLYNINAEFAAPLAARGLQQVAQTAVFSSLADGLCVSGMMTGSEVDTESLMAAKRSVRDVPVFANTGVTAENVQEKRRYADGAIVGTHLKEGGITWNRVDPERVKRFMAAVRSVRGDAA